MRTIVPSTAESKPSLPTTTPSPAASTTQRTPWHSPVPYLFGGLAAMLGLIAFALLILACSYWKVSAQSEERERSERDLEAGEGENEGYSDKAGKVYEEKILVIMAGDEQPTYLATPVCAKISAFGCGKIDNEIETTEKVEKEDCVKQKKDTFGDHDQQDSANKENTESQDSREDERENQNH